MLSVILLLIVHDTRVEVDRFESMIECTAALEYYEELNDHFRERMYKLSPGWDDLIKRGRAHYVCESEI